MREASGKYYSDIKTGKESGKRLRKFMKMKIFQCQKTLINDTWVSKKNWSVRKKSFLSLMVGVMNEAARLPVRYLQTL